MRMLVLMRMHKLTLVWRLGRGRGAGRRGGLPTAVPLLALLPKRALQLPAPATVLLDRRTPCLTLLRSTQISPRLAPFRPQPRRAAKGGERLSRPAGVVECVRLCVASGRVRGREGDRARKECRRFVGAAVEGVHARQRGQRAHVVRTQRMARRIASGGLPKPAGSPKRATEFCM